MSNSDARFVERAFGFIDALESDHLDIGTVTARVAVLSEECGYNYFTITRLPQPKLKLGPEMLLSRWSRPWLSYYDRVGLYRHDPIGRRCFETALPFLWSDVRYSGEDRMAAKVMGEAAEHGMKAGFCVPMFGPSGFQAVASFAGTEEAPSMARRRALHLVSIASYGWAERRELRRRDRQRELLSPRERDVLAWTALGLNKADVGERLGISELTVRTHIDRARHKLGATNTLGAVVEALRRREVLL